MIIGTSPCVSVLIFLPSHSPAMSLNQAFHSPIITESEGTQLVVRSDDIYSRLFWSNHLNPACGGKFNSDSEKLSPIVRQSLTCQTTADHLQSLYSPDASSPPGTIFHPTLKSVREYDPSLTVVRNGSFNCWVLTADE